MANTKNAIKADRQSKKRRTENRYVAKTTRNAIKKLRSTTTKVEADKLMPAVIGMIDKLAKKNVIKKNTAGNLKSGLMKKVGALK
mgnify:CR=1 FL=1